jgi:molecular chaperone DnaK
VLLQRPDESAFNKHGISRGRLQIQFRGEPVQKRHSRFDLVVRLATHAIHLLDRDGGKVSERIVRPPVDVLTRFGDPTPVRIDPAGRSPVEIVGDALAEALDGPLTDRRVLVLVPDRWGPHRRDLVTTLLAESGAEPEVRPETDFLLDHCDVAPAAEDRALWIRVGSELTTAALVHSDQGRWVHAHCVETGWGGDDIDDQLVGFVSHRLPDSNPAESLRTGCRDARERLSDQVTAGVTTSSGGVHVHRKDVEELAGPDAQAALTATLGQVLALSDEPTTSVLISGGTARMPLIAQLASEITGRPVRLVDWRDAVESVLEGPVATPVIAPNKDTAVLLPAQRRSGRRRAPFLLAAAGGVAILAFAVVGATQAGGSAGLMRLMLGEGNGSVPVGPPEAHAVGQTPEETPLPGSSTAPAGAPPAARTSSGAADPVTLVNGVPSASPSVPGTNPAAPDGVPGDPGDGTTAPAAPAPVPPPAAPAPEPTADRTTTVPRPSATTTVPPATTTQPATTTPSTQPPITDTPTPVTEDPTEELPAPDEPPATPLNAPTEDAEAASSPAATEEAAAATAENSAAATTEDPAADDQLTP